MPPLSTIWAPSASAVCGGDPADVVLSRPLVANLIVYRGDTGRFRVSVTLGGVLVDLTTATWDCDIRLAADSGDPPLASMTVTPIDDEIVEVVLDPLDSAVLPEHAVWDLQMTLDGNVHTLLRGTVTVTKDVSRGSGLTAFDLIVSPTDSDAVISLSDGVAEGFGTGTWTATVDNVTVPISATTIAAAVQVTVDCSGVATGVHTLVIAHSSGRTWTATLLMEAP